MRLRTRRDDRPLIRAVQERHPPFRAAVLADLRLAREQRGDRRALTSTWDVVREVLRLAWVTDAFGALVLYRLRASCQRRGIPVMPRLAHRASIMWAQVCIGDPVLIHPGVFLPHGQVVIDGFVEIHPGTRIRPFVTIGLKEGNIHGPTIHEDAKIGTGARVLGPCSIGAGAVIGANAVVTCDVPSNAVVAGVPARVIG